MDRFGRSLAHLVNAIQALSDAGVSFTSLGEGIDTRSATGRLMLGILGSFAEFERERIRERIHAGIARARRDGKRLGRRPHQVTDDDHAPPTCHSTTPPRRSVCHARYSSVPVLPEKVHGRPTFAPDSLGIAETTTPAR